MDIRYSTDDIINYFLSKEVDITPKRLQKLMYFAYSWYLAMTNELNTEINIKLFDEQFEAWIHGPVIPKLYHRYKKYGANPIPRYEGDLFNFSEDDKDILDEVWDVYKGYTANQLESISHKHNPWKLTRKEHYCSPYEPCRATIKDNLIFNYYASQLVSED